jgi:hypothetical protein
MLILDYTQDLSGANQHRLTQLYAPPDFVKQASHEQLCGGEEPLQPHLYGNAARRVYPCHTKAATWMSALFFGDKRSSLSPAEQSGIKTRIKEAATYWGIAPQVTELWTKMAEDAATGNLQLADDDFAMVWQGENGVKERHYPLRNGAEVKMASLWFGKYHDQFTFGDKHTIARKILTKAAAYGAAVDNNELLDRCAGFGYCAAETAAGAWQKRAGLIRQAYPDYSAQAENLAASILASTFEARDQGKRIKMAELMDQFDRQTGLNKLYDAGGLERPEDCLFCVTEKAAGDFVRDHVQTTTGTVYEKMALDCLDISHIRTWLGDEFADEVGGVMLDTTKLAEIVPTLPRPEAEMFERMATAAGIPVFARDKAAMDRGISPAEMAALAAQYGQEQPVPEDLLTI